MDWDTWQVAELTHQSRSVFPELTFLTPSLICSLLCMKLTGKHTQYFHLWKGRDFSRTGRKSWAARQSQ